MHSIEANIVLSELKFCSFFQNNIPNKNFKDFVNISTVCVAVIKTTFEEIRIFCCTKAMNRLHVL